MMINYRMFAEDMLNISKRTGADIRDVIRYRVPVIEKKRIKGWDRQKLLDTIQLIKKEAKKK